jgi:hypothetical protein
MRASACLVVTLLSLAGCAPPPEPLADEQPTFRQFHPDGALPPPAMGVAADYGRDSGADYGGEVPEPISPSRGVVLRSPAPPSAAVPPPVEHLPDAAFSNPFTPGPITGYGVGGMQHEPGMPHNPPWN